MKFVRAVARLIFIVCLPLLLLSASIAWGANSVWLYNYGFEKYGVSQTTGLSPVELKKAATGLISYFNSGDEYVHITVIKDGKAIELFNQEEAIHFRDVKQLFHLDYRILLVTLIYFLGYVLFYIFGRKRRYWRHLAWSMVFGSAFTLVLIVALGIASMMDFEQLFLQFHFLAFTNQFWSATGYMLLLFPGGFWFDAAMILIAGTAGAAFILGGAAAGYLRVVRGSLEEDSPGF